MACMHRTPALHCILVTALLAACNNGAGDESSQGKADSDLATLDISVDLSHLDLPTKEALRHLVVAADAFERLYFEMKQPGALLPVDATVAELDDYFKAHPDAGDWDSPFTVVRRTNDGFEAIPYSDAFATQLGPIVVELLFAATMIPDARVSQYLRVQAEALQTNNHSAAIAEWAKLDGSTLIEISAGFTEFSPVADGKAAPTLFMGLPNPAMQPLLASLEQRRAEMDAMLPRGAGFESWPAMPPHPLVLLDAFYITPQDPLWNGWAYNDMASGGPTLKGDFAGNLIAAETGVVTRPAAELFLTADMIPKVTEAGANLGVALHEFAHGIGPFTVNVDGKEVPIGEAMGTENGEVLYLGSEEPKADAVAALVAEQLFAEGVLPMSQRLMFHASHLASLLKQTRNTQDSGDPHGPGAIFTLNHLIAQGAIVKNRDDRFEINLDVLPAAYRSVTEHYLEILRTGDEVAARAVLDVVPRPELKAVIDAVIAAELPVESIAVFDIKEQLEIE